MIDEGTIEPDGDLIRASQWIGEAKNILFITGAGLSADSGLPTYRGIGGLYNSGETEEGLPIEEALSGHIFRQNPRITWKYLRLISDACETAGFNKGHAFIADLEKTDRRVWTLTQNIDGFHLTAGSRNLIEIHGNLREIHCTRCEYSTVTDSLRDYPDLPVCPQCQRPLRPAVVLFGENLPESEVETLYRELRQGFDLVVTIGTTSVFPYIAGPVIDASSRKIPTIEINPGKSQVSNLVGLHLKSKAAVTLEKIKTILTSSQNW